jgi:hypothetical protein
MALLLLAWLRRVGRNTGDAVALYRQDGGGAEFF